MLNNIKPFYFFTALSLGLLYVYAFTPVPDIIYQYPTPENAGKVTYKNNINECHKYESKEVDCPKDKSKITYYPQESN
tara:strand:- start:1033 stop:1266 length:234 start_codon:yes stop_codon:yes gene_type:complete